MSEQDYLDNRLQPDHTITEYHHYANKSSNYLQQIILQLVQENTPIITNDTKATKLQIVKELFNSTDTTLLLNKEEEIGQGKPIIINKEHSVFKAITQRLLTVYNLISITEIALAKIKPNIQSDKFIDDYSDYMLLGRTIGIASVLNSNDENTVDRYIGYLDNRKGMEFDYMPNFEKMQKVIEYLREHENKFDPDDKRDDDGDPTYTYNEEQAYNLLDSFPFDIAIDTQQYLFYTLLDAVLYDDNLKKIKGSNNTFSASLTPYPLDIKIINGVTTTVIEPGRNLILDDLQFIHLFKAESSQQRELDVAIDKAARIITRGFYSDNDGTVIYTDAEFAARVRKHLNDKDFTEYLDDEYTYKQQRDNFLVWEPRMKI